MASPKTKRSRSSLLSQTSSRNTNDITSLPDDSLSSTASLEICEPLQEPSLKERPIAGQKIDICDPEKIWASGTIVSYKVISKEEYSHSGIKRSHDEVDKSNCEYEVEVAYDGWGNEWNEKLLYPNPRIARHFAFSRQVKAFVDIGATKPKHISSSAVEPVLFWPCLVQIRMPTEGNQTSALFLELEKNVYVEPYLPTNEGKILPELRRVFPNCHKQKHKGELVVTGTWLQTKWIKPFREFDFTTFSSQQLLANFPLPGFISAYEEAIADKSTPGTLPKRLFAKGSLVNLCFREGTNYTGAFCDKSSKKHTATTSIHKHETAKEKPIVTESRNNNYTKSEHPVPPPKFPPSIRIAENLYPKTTRCSSEANSSPQWFGIVVTGGNNELIVGKFPSQTEAHEAAILAIDTCHKNDTCLNKADKHSSSITTDLNPEIHVQHNDPDTDEVMIDEEQPKANEPCISTTSPVAAKDKGDFVHKNEKVEQPLPEASAEESPSESVHMIGEYKVYIPITEEGMLMRIAPPSKSKRESMPGFDAIFDGFRKFSDGRKSEPELKNLIHGIGDWIVQVDDVSTMNMTFKQVMDLITEKKKQNPCGMTLTFLDCNNEKTMQSETIVDCIDLTTYDDEKEMMDTLHICIDVADGEIERTPNKSSSLSKIMEPVIDLSLESPTDECFIDVEMRDVPKMATKDVPRSAMNEECTSKGDEEKDPAAAAAAANTTRQIEIGMEQDIQKISLQAVVAAAESMLDPSLHTFIMQEWTIELIRHKAYLKEVTNDSAASNLDDFSRQQCLGSFKDEGGSKNNRKSKPRRLLV